MARVYIAILRHKHIIGPATIQQCKTGIILGLLLLLLLVLLFVFTLLRLYLEIRDIWRPGMVFPGRGTAWHRSWTSREIRDGWQPYVHTTGHESPSCDYSAIVCCQRARGQSAADAAAKC